MKKPSTFSRPHRRRPRLPRRPLRLEQLESRFLLARVLLEPGWSLCGDAFHPNDVPRSSESEATVCVTNDGPGTVWVEIASDEATLWPAEGDRFRLSVTGRSGARGDALWQGDATELVLTATGSIGPVSISGSAFLTAGKDIEAVSAAQAALSAGDAVGAVQVGRLVSLYATEAGAVHVRQGAGTIAVSERLASLTVGGDAGPVTAGQAGAINIGGDLAALIVRSDLSAAVTVGGSSGPITARSIATTISVGADLETVRATGDFRAGLAVDGMLGELVVDGTAAGTIEVAEAIDSILLGAAAQLDVLTAGPVGTIRSRAGGYAGAVRATGLGELASNGPLTVTLAISGPVGSITAQKGSGDLSGSIGGPVTQIASAGQLTLALDVAGTVNAVQAGGDLLGALSADAITHLTVAGDLNATVETTSLIQQISVAGSLLGTITSGATTAVRIDGDFAGQIRSLRDVVTVKVGGNVSGELDVGTNIGTLSIAGTLSGQVVAGGSIVELTIGADIVGRVAAQGTITSVRVRDAATGTMSAAAIGEIRVGRRLGGTLRSRADIDAVTVGWDFDRQQRAAGTLDGALIDVGGDLKSLQVFRGSAAQPETSTAMVQVDGSAGAIRIDTAFTGTIRVSGTANKLAVGGSSFDRSTVTLDVGGGLGEVVSQGSLTLELRSAGDVAAVRSGGDLDASIRVAGNVARVHAQGGSLTLEAEVSGRIDAIVAGADATVGADVGGGLGELLVGTSGGGSLSGWLTVGGPVGSIVVWDELPPDRRFTTVEEATDSTLPQSALVRNSVQLVKPVRPVRPARGHLGNASITLNASGPVQYLLAAGNLSGTIQAEALQWLYAGGDMQAQLELSSDQPVAVDAWGDAVVELATNGTADVTAFGNLELNVRQVGALLDAGSWASLRLSANARGDVRAWSWYDATMVVTALGNVTATWFASAAMELFTGGSVQAVAYEQLVASGEVSGKGESIFVAHESLSVDLAAPDGTIYLYSWGDARWQAHGQRVRATSWAQASGSIAAATTAEVYVLGQARLDVAAGEEVIYEAGSHTGSLRSYGTLSFEIFDSASGLFQAAGELRGYVHGFLAGKVQNTAGPTQLDTSGPLTATVTAAGPVVLDVGSLLGSVTTDSSLVAVVHEDLSATLRVGAGARLEVWGEATGDWRILGPLDAEVHGDLTATVQTTGDVHAVVGGSWTGSLVATSVGPEEAGAEGTASPQASLYVYGRVDGHLQADGSITITGLGGISGSFSSAGDTVTVVSGQMLDAAVTARNAVRAAAAGTIDLSVHAGGRVIVNGYADVTAVIDAAKSVTLASAGRADVSASVQRDVQMRALEKLDAAVEAGGDVTLASGGALAAKVRADGSISAAAYGPLAMSATAGSSVNARSWGDLQLEVTSPAAVEVIAAGSVLLDLEAADGLIDALSTVAGRAAVTGSLRILAHGSVTGTYLAGRTLEIASGGDAVGEFRSGGTLQLHAADGVAGNLFSGGPLTVTAADGAFDGVATSSGALLVVTANGISGQLIGQPVTLRTNGPVAADVDSSRWLTLETLSDAAGTWRAEGDALVTAGGTIRGELTVGGSALVAAAGSVLGDVAAGDALAVYAAGAVHGQFRSPHAMEVVSLSDVLGTYRTAATLTIRAGGDVRGELSSGGVLDVRAMGSFVGRLHSGGPIHVATGNALRGTLATDGNATVLSDGPAALQLAAGGNVLAATASTITGRIEADGTVDVRALEPVSLEIRARDVSAWTAAGGHLQVNTDGAFRLLSLAESVTVSVESGAAAEVFSGGPLTLDGRSNGPLSATSLSSLTLAWQANESVLLRAGFGGLSGKLRAYGDADIVVLGDTVLEARVAGNMTVATVGDVAGTLTAGRQVRLSTWGALDNVAIEANGEVAVTAVAGGVADVTAGGRVIGLFVEPGSLAVSSDSSVRLTALTDGALVVRRAGEVVARYAQRGLLRVDQALVVDALAGGALHAAVEAARQVTLVAGGELAAQVAAERVRAEAWAEATIGIVDAGVAERLWSVGDMAVAAQADYIQEVRSYGSLDANLRARACDNQPALPAGDTGPHPCGYIESLRARGNLGGVLVAAEAIGELRAGGAIEADLFAPRIGQVVPFDEQLAAEAPPPRPQLVDEALLALRRSLLQEQQQAFALRDAFRREVDAFSNEVRRWRSEVARRVAAAREAAVLEGKRRRTAAYDAAAARRRAAADAVRHARTLRDAALQQLLDEADAARKAVATELDRNRTRRKEAVAALDRFVSRSLAAAQAEQLDHDASRRQLLAARDEEAQRRPDAWLEALDKAKDQALADVQRITSLAALVPGYVGTLGGAVHFAVTIVHGDMHGAAVDLIARSAREFVPGVGRAIAQGMGTISAIQEWTATASDDGGSPGTQRPDGRPAPGEPACFVAGTPVVVVETDTSPDSHDREAQLSLALPSTLPGFQTGTVDRTAGATALSRILAWLADVAVAGLPLWLLRRGNRDRVRRSMRRIQPRHRPQSGTRH